MSIMSRDAYCDGASLPEHNFLLGFEPSSDVEDAPVVNVRRVLPARSLLSELIASNAEDRQHNELFVEYRDSMDTARTQNSEYSDEDSLESQITSGFQPNRSTQPIKIEKDDALMQKVQKECYRRMLVAYEAAEMQRALAYQAQMYKDHSHW